jgi:hypothetical protein
VIEFNPSIKLKIEGNRIPEKQFRNAIESFFDLVDEISQSVTGKTQKVKWLVSVKPGSVEIHLSSDQKTKQAEYVPRIAAIIDEGIKGIAKPDFKSQYYSDKALESIRRMAISVDPSKEEIEAISISVNGKGTFLTPEMIVNIDSLLEIKREEYGSIEGRLDLISSRKGYHFFITDNIRNHPVKCDFPEIMKERILASFNKKVYIFGLIKYRKGNIPYSIQLQYIKTIKDQNLLPTADEVFGILKGIN